MSEQLEAVVPAGCGCVVTDEVEASVEAKKDLQPVGVNVAEAVVAASGNTSQLSPSIPVTISKTAQHSPSTSSANSVMPTKSTNYITPSQSNGTDESTLVYALGTLGYDFGTEARRDSFKQLMPGVNVTIPGTDPQTPPTSTLVPSNPYDARQMADYLSQSPSEAKSLIWTLNLELTPIYAIEPVGPFASDVYRILQQSLAGEVLSEDNEDFVERVSIPGRLTGKTVKLFSGQVVPVIQPENERGMYSWKVNNVVSAVMATVSGSDREALRRTLSNFLVRIYYEYRNLGTTSRDRALNFAATNFVQAARSAATAVDSGKELDSIEVEKSPFCRIDSDCWDVKLKFFDPENKNRARQVFRYTVDVSDIFPVTLGEPKSWSAPN